MPTKNEIKKEQIKEMETNAKIGAGVGLVTGGILSGHEYFTYAKHIPNMPRSSKLLAAASFTLFTTAMCAGAAVIMPSRTPRK